MSKITIKYYLNKSISPINIKGKICYPLYVQIIANKQNFKMKSDYPFDNGYLNDLDFFSEFATIWIENDKKKILKIVSYFIENDKLQLLKTKNFKEYSKILYVTLFEKINLMFKKELINLKIELPDVLFSLDFRELRDFLWSFDVGIENKFSEKYKLCLAGVMTIIDIFELITDQKNEKITNRNIETEFKDLNKITVFDFMFTDKRNLVKNAIEYWEDSYLWIDDKKNISYKIGTEEYFNAVTNELEKLIFDEF